jgi:murein DD-endopeptidase MepM/ murein hydrolase activator NlpD
MKTMLAALLLCCLATPAPARDATSPATAQEAPSPAQARPAPGPDRETICAIGRGPKCDVQDAIRRGLFETGLRPVFPDGARCRDIDERWAISYTNKRDREQYHGGIDMPAPYGEPMLAAADGEVVAVFEGANSYRGREVILRHSPEQTGLPVWIYTEYAHFDAPPKVRVGDFVRQGQDLGPTGNSGRGKQAYRQSGKRRPAIHFAAFYSASEHYVIFKDRVVVPVDGWWMDPNALYRGRMPLDSASLKALPDEEKKVPVAVIYEDGEVYPAGARFIWPYACKRR